MKLTKFVTEIFKGKFNLDDSIVKDYQSWAKFEKELDPYGKTESTTFKGWQFSFSNSDKPPVWLRNLTPNILEIKKELCYTTVKSMWTIEYEIGGFQDPHFHQPGNNLYTVIINLSGSSELLLFDPRQIATAHGESIVDVEILKQGDWIAMPSWLTHSTRPCNEPRTILVMDVHR